MAARAATAHARAPCLQDFPDHVLEKVLQTLPLGEVARLRAVSRRFRAASGRVLRGAVLRLRVQVERELLAQRAQLLAAPHRGPLHGALNGPLYSSLQATLHDPLRGSCLVRSFATLELLRSELLQLLALCRWPLLGANAVFPAGHLLDAFFALLHKARARELPPWGAGEDPAAPLLRALQRFLRGFLEAEAEGAVQAEGPLRPTPPLGAQLVDLLDALLDADCSQEVRWDSGSGRVALRVEYVLRDALFACLPSDVAALQTEGYVTFAEAQRLLAWVALLVRYNNRLRLREEQCLRQLHPDASLTLGALRLRSYPAPAPCPLLLSPDNALAAAGDSPQRLRVQMRLSCALCDAPLRLLERWAAASGRPSRFLRALGYAPAARAPLDPARADAKARLLSLSEHQLEHLRLVQ